MIPKSLKNWFTIHFLIDWIIGIPLFIAPVWTLSLFNLTITNSLTARLVAAALIAIGGTSLIRRNASKESYKSLLNLKIIWSLFAIIALVIELVSNQTSILFWLLGIFIIFNLIWIKYRLKLFS